MKKTTAMLLAFILCLFAACGGEDMPADTAAPPASSSETPDPYAGLTRYEHPIGIALYMDEGFTEGEIEGILACYEGAEVNVRFAVESLESLAALGYEDMTEMEYAALIRDTYQVAGEPLADENGNVCLPYIQDIQGVQVAYYAYFNKTADAFWTTTFMCMAEGAAAWEADFALWAQSIEITAAAAEALPPESQLRALTDEESEALSKVLDKLAPIDCMGGSFVPAELSNDEMLRLTYAVFGAQEYGIVGIEGAYFRDSIAGRYFGYTDLELTDMVCSCGATLAAYDAAADQYSWDGAFHDYTAHFALPYTEYRQVYALGGQYVVTSYKIFPDLTENITGDAIRFYATYADAAAQQNALFTAAGEEAFQAGLASLTEEQKVLHSCTFEKDAEGNFILVDYTVCG